jgi:meiotically up-regulated gene 157 (Mug157) protein
VLDIPTNGTTTGLTTLALLLNTNFPKQHNLILPQPVLEMCHDCFWQTLKTTTKFISDETFVFTGDIGDMWLRDSAAQVHPYIPFAKKDPLLRRVIEGLIKRQAFYINYDPYANSFRSTIDQDYVFTNFEKVLGRYGYVTTWNYELDNGCYFLRLLYTYWRTIPDSKIIRKDSVRDAARRMVELWEVEQYHGDDIELSGYYNIGTQTKLYRYPELCCGGKGSPVNYTGMTWTGFRPSDDGCRFGYLIPSNMFASVALNYLTEMAPLLWDDIHLSVRAQILREQIDLGIRQHGIVDHPEFGKIYAYEVDGLGNYNLMDDANVPSLMSIPYLGWEYDPTIYENTRKFILSPMNPTYSQNQNGTIRGYGSPHTDLTIPKAIWPMAQIIQGLTSENVTEKLDVLQQLLDTDAGGGHMHESYNPNNPYEYTRSWFCWADALFAEFVMSLTLEDCPGETPYVSHLRVK